MNTLLYAAKAQVISNEPIVNEDPKVKKMRELQTHVSSLTNQLKQANNAIEFFKKMMNGEEASKFNFGGLVSSLENVNKKASQNNLLNAKI